MGYRVSSWRIDAIIIRINWRNQAIARFDRWSATERDKRRKYGNRSGNEKRDTLKQNMGLIAH
jgi:hypothetical protein